MKYLTRHFLVFLLGALASVAHVQAQRDRKLAIRHALEQAGVNDVVLVAGKGHEDYQIIGAERRHFSDAQVIAQWLDEQEHT